MHKLNVQLEVKMINCKHLMRQFKHPMTNYKKADYEIFMNFFLLPFFR